MLEAVHTIHEGRIVHGDLKPANFLFVQVCTRLSSRAPHTYPRTGAIGKRCLCDGCAESGAAHGRSAVEHRHACANPDTAPLAHVRREGVKG